LAYTPELLKFSCTSRLKFAITPWADHGKGVELESSAMIYPALLTTSILKLLLFVLRLAGLLTPSKVKDIYSIAPLNPAISTYPSLIVQV